MVFTIRNKNTGSVLVSEEAEKLKNIVERHKLILQDADLQKADLWAADLHGANFEGSDLRGCSLRSSDLSKANLKRCDLRGTDLRKADLSNADLTDAILGWTMLAQADITGIKTNKMDEIKKCLQIEDTGS